ncbi:hypothetical protein LY78DRAFT_300957 [Colletotrichum sublineola]|nr:hypothetical protein LY78DRAFT_300957 [Colletotrichum sublineola]
MRRLVRIRKTMGTTCRAPGEAKSDHDAVNGRYLQPRGLCSLALFLFCPYSLLLYFFLRIMVWVWALRNSSTCICISDMAAHSRMAYSYTKRQPKRTSASQFLA